MTRRCYGRGGRAASARELPSAFAFSDPRRFPDLTAWARRVPEDWGLVYRHFGNSQRFNEAGWLSRQAVRRGWTLLIAADADLALECGAAGVHWPEARLTHAAAWQRRCPGFVMTASAHSASALRRAGQAGMDAAFLSPVRPTLSPGAGSPLGLHRAGLMARRAGLPVYALGGMRARDIAHANRLGLAGIATVSGVKD
ncbi:thiamine phosphate synthase [Hyphobacterium marinum]|uniref:Thiamine phosphate synthase n=1 Tax=Hyphobacterium marinum TaxID=3116574 RepID=A0ABU7LUX5_9PROT|nr:thiamine phosphate synthase [Hyphobacterium sp. Y6023]MEE2565355.1 thiamine phosphate synthase [Hyphobacterium sp. Y6023]